MITIDGVLYTVPVIEIQRKAEALDKFAERSADGALHRELIGWYQNYTIQFGTGADTAAYAALWLALTEPVEFHTFIIPDGAGEHTFEGYVSSPEDTMFKYKDPQAFYKNLTVTLISRYATRTPA